MKNLVGMQVRRISVANPLLERNEWKDCGCHRKRLRYPRGKQRAHPQTALPSRELRAQQRASPSLECDGGNGDVDIVRKTR